MDPALVSTVPVLFAAAVAFCVAVYVLADGFDLGVGILLPAAPREQDMDRMIASVGPAWDGNETWLVMAGTILFAAFPAAYRDLMPAFGLPVVLMLLALLVRGTAYAVRRRTAHLRWLCDVSFAAGSIVAAMCQGLVLGGLLGGLPLDHGTLAGGALALVSPLGLLCALGLLGGYALLGAGWLIWETEGTTQRFGREAAGAALIVTVTMMLAVAGCSIWTSPEIAARWLSWPQGGLLALIPLSIVAVTILAWRRIWSGGEHQTFVSALAIVLLAFAGLIASLWPYMVPRQLTIWQASSDPRVLMSFDKGIAVIIPIVLLFQAHAYWVFRERAAQEALKIPSAGGVRSRKRVVSVKTRPNADGSSRGPTLRPRRSIVAKGRQCD